MKTVNKNLLKKVVASSAALALPLALIVKEGQAAGESANANAKAKIKVLRALTISKSQDLDFGIYTTADTGVKTVLNSDHTNSAKFDISGNNGKSITISVDPSVNMDNTDTSYTPSTDANARIVANLDPSASTLSLTGGTGAFGTGTATLYVGGHTDALSGTQYAGDFEGTFTVTIVYN